MNKQLRRYGAQSEFDTFFWQDLISKILIRQLYHLSYGDPNLNWNDGAIRSRLAKLENQDYLGLTAWSTSSNDHSYQGIITIMLGHGWIDGDGHFRLTYQGMKAAGRRRYGFYHWFLEKSKWLKWRRKIDYFFLRHPHWCKAIISILIFVILTFIPGTIWWLDILFHH